MLALLLAAAALAPCAPETPPALQLTGIPSVAIPGHGYAASLVGRRAGGRLGGLGHRRQGRARGAGWTAHYEYARGVTQAFSVGLQPRAVHGHGLLDRAGGHLRPVHCGPSRSRCRSSGRSSPWSTASAAPRSRRAGSSCAATAPSCGSRSLSGAAGTATTTTGARDARRPPGDGEALAAARVLASSTASSTPAPRVTTAGARRSSASLSTVRFLRGHEDLDRPRPGAEAVVDPLLVDAPSRRSPSRCACRRRSCTDGTAPAAARRCRRRGSRSRTGAQ